MNIPDQIRAGDTVKWRVNPTTDAFGNAVDSGSWALTYYLRTNTASEGATVVGSAYGNGWELTISAATSSGFDAGQWYWQAVATKASEKITIGSGGFEVLPGLGYAGSPSAFDGRSQARKDLDAVDAAIRAIISGGGVAEYSIGQRSLKKYSLSELQVLRSRLIAEVKREEAASMIAQGLGNPHNLFVRF